MDKPLSKIEISKPSLVHNLHEVRSIVGSSTNIAATVKANAYGHGLVDTAKVFLSAGADWLSVIEAGEAEALREAGVKAPILLLGVTPESRLKSLIRQKVRLFIPSREYASAVQKAARDVGRKAYAHAKIDTGMGRYGVLHEDAGAFIQVLRELSHIELEGVGTHFATADQPQSDLFHTQQARFERIAGCAPIAHCSNTAALIGDDTTHMDMVRPGICLYGYHPSESLEKYAELDLKPALRWKTQVVQKKQLPAGSSISYGATKTLQEERDIAILPVGYYDGVDCALSNTGEVLIAGKRASILGRVCMDLTIVDVTDIDRVLPGDTVTIIGENGGEQISASDIAKRLDTVPYEVLVRLRESIPRIYVDK